MKLEIDDSLLTEEEIENTPKRFAKFMNE